MTSASNRLPATRRPVHVTAPILVLAGLWSFAAAAVGVSSTYPGCASRSVSVAKGGSVTVDLAQCHSFGLGVVARPPSQGTATPGDSAPVDSYVYSHGGGDVAVGAVDTFVVLDDNSDFITVRVSLLGGTSSIVGAPAALPPMSAGNTFEQALSASGGIAPYAYRLAAGILPAGLSLEPGGRLSGTPTHRGPFSFSVRVTDARGASADKSYGGTVGAGTLTMTPASMAVDQGRPLSQSLAVTGGVPPHRFALEPGPGLPPGLGLSSAGVVSGSTGISPGVYPVTVRVTDSSTGTGDYFELESLTLVVNAGAVPSVTISVSPAAVAEDEGVALVYTVTRSARLATATVVNITPSGTARTRVRAAVVIPAGATSADITIQPKADATAEPDETVVLTIAPGIGYTVGEAASASATLVDDDLP